MNDYTLLEYLRKNGNRDEYDMLDEFKDYMRSRGRISMRGMRRHREEYEFPYEEDYRHNEGYRSYRRHSSYGSFDEHSAREIVSEMYHYDNDRKVEGEKFNMKKAEEIYHKYRDSIHSDVSIEDIYVAINATYHDFCSLLKSWFGINIEDKVIMLAITWWFKDADYKGNKLMDYFMK